MKQQINRHEMDLLDGLALTATAQHDALKATMNNIRMLLLVDAVADQRANREIEKFVANGAYTSIDELVIALEIEVNDPLVQQPLRVCSQHGCDEPGAFRYVWPGRPSAFICNAHAEKLIGTAAALGFELELFPVSQQRLAPS